MTDARQPSGSDHPVFAAGILQGLHLLEADAGTGKTWTLTGLMVRAIVERGLSVDSILAVTFTTAAVAELKSRARSRLAQMIDGLQADARHEMRRPDPFVQGYCERLQRGLVVEPNGSPVTPDRALARLRLAMAGCDEIAVLTLHGFCQRLLASQPLSSRAPMLLEPGADRNAGVEPLVRQWWRQHLQSRDFEDLWLLDLLPLRIGRLVEAVALRLADPLARMNGPLPDWRAALIRAPALRRQLAEAIEREGEQFVAWYGGGKAGVAKLPGNRVKGPVARGHLAELMRFAQADAIVKWPDKAIAYFTSEKITAIGGNIGLLSKTALVPVCDQLSDWYRDELNPVFGSMVEEAARHADAQRAEQMFRSRSVSFDDLIRLAYEALLDSGNGSRLAAGVREHFPMALVDECQDTDPLQWAILQQVWPASSLRDECALVLVGDPKQSIYRFRGADLFAYLEARRAWGPAFGRAGKPGLRPKLWRLDENQRSDAGLLSAVSALFLPKGSFLIDEIVFQAARPGNKQRGLFVDGRHNRDQAMCWIDWTYDKAIDRQVVARACALEIASLLTDPKVTLDGRALQARDIAVLVGSHDEGKAVKQQLRSLGLAAAETSRDQVMDSIEAWEIMRIVAAVAEPAETGLVRGALATQALGVALSALDEIGREQLLVFEQARLAWPRLGPIAALTAIFDSFDTATRLASSDGAERSLTNHVHVLDLLAAADEARGSAAAALRWLQRVIEQGRRVEGAAEELELRLESDANLVRILTVHKSKGLEFPVVFVPFAWRGRKSRTGPLIRYCARDGDGNWSAVIDAAFKAGDVAKAAQQQEDLAERIRLLYVAVTRAQHRCYVVRPGSADYADSDLDTESGSGSPAGSALDHVLKHAEKSPLADSIGLRLDIRSLLDKPTADTRIMTADSGAIQLARFDRVLRRSWQNSSFTALLAANGRDQPAEVAGSEIQTSSQTLRDMDQSVVEPEPGVLLIGAQHGISLISSEAPSGGIRHVFPAGAQAGTCLHRILEQAPAGAAVPAELVARELLAHGLGDQPAAEVAAWLDEVLGATLPDAGVAINAVRPVDRVVELEFQMAVNNLNLAAMVSRIGRSEPIDIAAGERRIHGYLNGFIDLVFRHAGRYYILDWKSNRLGDSAEHYSQAIMVDAIRGNGYALQYCIYQLALHRHLRHRLAGYDPARHLGGVFYLFIRGAGAASPSRSSRDSHDKTGIYFRPPDVALIRELDELAGNDPALIAVSA